MASDVTMRTLSSSMQGDEDDDVDDGHEHDFPQSQNLSRLSMCTSSLYTNEDDDDDGDCDGMRMFMSRLSIESFDADEELSEGKETTMDDLSSDSDKEAVCYSLPATPPRRRNRRGLLRQQQQTGATKDYASENEEAKKGIQRKNLRSRRRIARQRRDGSNDNNGEMKKEENLGVGNNKNIKNGFGGCKSWSGGESEGGGLVVITRAKGGKRRMCMGLEEVKACRDLGLELEHEAMVEMPTCRVSLSPSTLDTSSGSNSPIATWRISTPGDDPRDVKARLRVWAQAVAIASASRHCGI